MAIPFLIPVDMGGLAIQNVADPSNPQDAATKAYVDANAGGGGDLTHPTKLIGDEMLGYISGFLEYYSADGTTRKAYVGVDGDSVTPNLVVTSEGGSVELRAAGLTKMTVANGATLSSQRHRISEGATGNAYNQGAVEIYEEWEDGTGLAPRIAFHYAGAVASQIGFAHLDNSGDVSILDNPGTGYEALRVRELKIDAGGDIILSRGSSATTRLVVKSQGVNEVAQFAGYGMYLPQGGQAYNLYLYGSLKIGNGENAKWALRAWETAMSGCA